MQLQGVLLPDFWKFTYSNRLQSQVNLYVQPNFSGKDVCIRVTAVDLSLLTGEPFSSGLSCSFSSGNHAFTPVADGKFHLAASSRILRQHICRRILARSR